MSSTRQKAIAPQNARQKARTSSRLKFVLDSAPGAGGDVGTPPAFQPHECFPPVETASDESGETTLRHSAASGMKRGTRRRRLPISPFATTEAAKLTALPSELTQRAVSKSRVSFATRPSRAIPALSSEGCYWRARPHLVDDSEMRARTAHAPTPFHAELGDPLMKLEPSLGDRPFRALQGNERVCAGARQAIRVVELVMHATAFLRKESLVLLRLFQEAQEGAVGQRREVVVWSCRLMRLVIGAGESSPIPRPG